MSTCLHANPRAPQQPAGTGHTGIYRVLGELTRWYRMQELSRWWKLWVPKATGGAEGPRWLSAQDSGQDWDHIKHSQHSSGWQAGAPFTYWGLLLNSKLQTNQTFRFGFCKSEVSLAVCGHNSAPQLRAHPCLASTSSAVSHYQLWLSYLQFCSFILLKVSLAGMSCGSHSDHSRIPALRVKSPAPSVRRVQLSGIVWK